MTRLIPTNAKGERTGWRRGIFDVAPMMLGFIPFALVLGAQAADKRFTVLEVPLMTGLNFGGGSEFAAVALWTSPPAVALIVAITFLVNSRHFLMGATLAPHMQDLSRAKSYLVLFLMCDESWAMGLSDARKRGGSLDFGYYMGVALGLYFMWVTCTTIGAVVGPMIGDVKKYGLDMAFPAVFLFMLAGMWKGPKNSIPWLASLIAAGGTYLLIPGAWYVPAGALSGLLVSYLMANAND